ncbi:MAG: bifunctional adenosylcobinamide kinase/adenosylcobinamide-phosphate guanylyltransferase [Candidatus Omnitrophica bacterium]|nr:bifunctional adenosylcobinamide kinase/adenosylcobinamide-phosphate guanylyltransferase [Candidatus Omnitrophota bacterium]
MFPRGRGTETSRPHTFPRLILVTGGARAGKSRFALGLAEKGRFRRRLFVATGVPCDGEMAGRIARHRRERNGSWVTVEEPLNLPERLKTHRLSSGTLLLLDCLPTFVTNHLLANSSPSRIESRVGDLLKACRRAGLSAILVSNEVGLGIVPDHPLGRRFRDLLGRINQRVAEAADEVYLLVAGIPVRLK